MRRAGLLLLIFLVAGAACSSRPRRPTDEHRALTPGEIQTFEVSIKQKRVAEGPDSKKELATDVVLKLEEEAQSESKYTIVVRDAIATGETTQIEAARRLIGRRIDIDLEKRTIRAVAEVFAGTQDVAAADIGLLMVLLAPLLPSKGAGVGDKWRANANIPLAWSQSAAAFTVDHELTVERVLRGLESAAVFSTALANVSFRIELVREVPPEQAQREGGAQADGRGFIVNQLFEELFSDVNDPVHATVAAIAAIPLAVAAPFLALAEGLAGLFGGGSSSKPAEPSTPVVVLSGPLELKTMSDVWRDDGRVLQATGTGNAALTGTLPELGGEAAVLSGKPLRMTSDWTYSRKLTSAWPDPLDTSERNWVLLGIAMALVLAAAFVTFRFGKPLRLAPPASPASA